jgi:uncharacterized membrane-anchored protein YitT (DUF2179 family)
MTSVFKNSIMSLLYILSGSVLMAFGITAFLAPNHIATGGTAGLAIVMDHVYPISIGVWMTLINIPLLILSVKYIGKKFAVKTILSIVFIVLSVELLVNYFVINAFSNDLMLSTLYGGILIGTGLGLIFKGGASAGGASIIAKILTANYGVKTSTTVMILDAFVILMAGLVFKSIELALWSLISIYVGSKLIDMILVGAQNQKIVHISSIKNLHELSKIISDELGISGTVIKGNDLQISEYKDIIFLMIDKNRLQELKQIVFNYDSHVKMIVMEANEVLGN